MEDTTPMTPPKPFLPAWAIALIVVLVGTLGVLAATGLLSNKPNTGPAPAETVTPSPTPTPIRTPSAIASQSAFLSLEIAVASLSAHIQGLPAADPSLSPPVLDLELGFEN